MNSSASNSYRIVLTGGPGGGKSTAADLIRREVGDHIVVVPEAATMLFSGGFPRYDDRNARIAAQKAIFHVQRNIEDVQQANFPGRILLCDRGTVDGAAYWPDKDSDFFEQMHSSLTHELGRYDAVIFFETAAAGDILIEGGNRVRTEDTATALALDLKLKEFWSQHPRFAHIPHQRSFFHKLQNALSVIQETITTLDELNESLSKDR